MRNCVDTGHTGYLFLSAYQPRPHERFFPPTLELADVAYGSAIRRSVSLRILFGRPAMVDAVVEKTEVVARGTGSSESLGEYEKRVGRSRV